MTETPQPEQPQPTAAQPAPAAAPQKRDTTIGWLSHLLVLLTGFIGPLILWAVKKDSDDKYGVFHAKQCMFWGIAWWALQIISGMTMFIFIGFCLLPIVGLGGLVYTVIGLIQTAQGKPFKYFFVADKFCAEEFAAAYPEVPAE